MFKPKKDPIAITVKRFKLLKSSDRFFGSGADRYNEPYIVSLSVDEGGNSQGSLFANQVPFEKIKQGQQVALVGDGHLVYGPKNPGDFVAFSILAMESDNDIRRMGEDIDTIVKSKAVDLGVGTIVAANPGAAVALSILRELTSLVAHQLKNDKDDVLGRVDGLFLRDKPVPYDINRVFSNQGTDFFELDVGVIALGEANGEGPEPQSIKL